MKPLGRRGLIALDGLAAAVYALVLIASPWRAGWWVATLGLAAPLVVRRLRPAVVFGAVLTLSGVGFVLGVVHDLFVAAAFALYPVALVARPRRGTAGVAVASGVLLFLALVTGTGGGALRSIGPVVVGVALLGGAWTVGRAVRERRLYAARSAGRLARQAVTDERLRIARELHDVVANAMGVIAVKAAIANHVADERPAEVRDALRAIEATSRSALAEMRLVLGELRAEPDFDGLADRAALVGVPVKLALDGVELLPDEVRLAVYRIVQEALTNVIRHAAPATAEVTVRCTGTAVEIGVLDDGGATDAVVEGHGITGMRERAVEHGGTFSAGPRASGGFAVCAWIPL